MNPLDRGAGDASHQMMEAEDDLLARLRFYEYGTPSCVKGL